MKDESPHRESSQQGARAGDRRPGGLRGRDRQPADPGEGAHPAGRRDRRGPPAPADGRGRRQPRADRATRTGHAAGRVRGPAQLLAYYFMWNPGKPAPDQCEGCTWVTTQVQELAYLHSRDITYAVFCQGPYDESARYRDFMDWRVPWYSALPSLDDCSSAARGDDAHRQLSARRRSRLRDVLDDATRRRGDGLQPFPDGSDGVRTPGAMGALPRRLAAGLGRRRLQHPDRRTADPPVVAAGSRTFGRPRRVIVGAGCCASKPDASQKGRTSNWVRCSLC